MAGIETAVRGLVREIDPQVALYQVYTMESLVQQSESVFLRRFPLILLGADDGLDWALAGVLGWAFALWGVGLYWWAGLLYLIQTLRLLRDVPPRPRAG